MASATMERNGTVSDARIRRTVQQELEGAEVETTLSESDMAALVKKTRTAIQPEIDATATKLAAWAEQHAKPQEIDLPKLVEEVRKAMKPIVKHLEVKAPDGKLRKVEGKTHAAYEKVLKLAGQRKNIFLIGPAGCGKTHLAQQVAYALGLSFSFISCSAGMSEGQLLGRLVPTGKGGKFEYVRSEFVRCYEEGGVFLFDEVDGADANTLFVLMTALANGHLAVPNRPDKPIAVKHPDFVCIAAANTYGTGANRQYVGANQLDERFLDRFRIGQIEMDYDADVEESLCDDTALLQRLRGYRAKIDANKVRRLVSMRFMKDACEMKAAGFRDEDIDAALFAGWSEHEIRLVKGA